MIALIRSHLGILRRGAVTLCIGALACLFATGIRADAARDWQYMPHPSNLEAREWFQNARFGVFVHWGIYSVLGDGAWAMYDEKIPLRRYEMVADFFYPQAFDADEWVRTFKEAGARYVTVTAKHHDGFAMYDSAASDYDIVDRTPYGKDVVAELKKACDRHGLKLFLYYSQLDWHHPDYYPPGKSGQKILGGSGNGDWDRYIDYMNTQLTELLTQHEGIGGIWFDGWWDQKDTAVRDRWRLQETYELIHRLQPQALIISNHHTMPFPGEDAQPFEQDLPGENKSGLNTTHVAELPLEMADTMSRGWAFRLHDTKFKTTRQLIHMLVAAAGRNANLLLNTGPMPNGKLQPENVAAFGEIGDWLRAYGESIYGTRGGPLEPRDWGVSTQTDAAVYLHVTDPDVDELRFELDADFSSAVLLRNGNVLELTGEGDTHRVSLPPPAESEYVRVVKLSRTGKRGF